MTQWNVKRQKDNGGPLSLNPWETIEEKIVEADSPTQAAEKAFPDYEWQFCIRQVLRGERYILSNRGGVESLVAESFADD